MEYHWKLMEDAIGEKEKGALIDFIRESNRFTNGPKVREFEEAWSKWLGVKHSVFVNSGSSANLVLLYALKRLHFKDKTVRVLTPACTWATNVSSLLQLEGFEVVFSETDLYDFGIDSTTIHDDIDVVFVTHLMGSPSNISALKTAYPNAFFIEDCCESHGADIDGQKVGTFGIGSTFSFYYGHHMTTIEGGMVSTNDDEMYDYLLMMRSHGMSRSLDAEGQIKYAKENPDIDPRFLFPVDGFNLRNTEIGAVIGLTQLDNLDDYIEIRKRNLHRFDKLLQKFEPHVRRYNLEGNSAMTLPILCNEKRDELMKAIDESGVETRPFLVGNILRQPYMKEYFSDKILSSNQSADWLHENAFYIGNSQFLTEEKIDALEPIFRKVFKE